MKSKKTATDLSAKHFSRYGEFLVSFELSKYGWNVYEPVYDEYINFIIYKHTCTDCDKNWNLTPALVCKKCGKDFSKTQKSKIIAKKICEDCQNASQCPDCSQLCESKGKIARDSYCGPNQIDLTNKIKRDSEGNFYVEEGPINCYCCCDEKGGN